MLPRFLNGLSRELLEKAQSVFMRGRSWIIIIGFGEREGERRKCEDIEGRRGGGCYDICGIASR